MYPSTDNARLAVPIGPRDHTFGPPTAPVTLLEYGDYECPYCGQAHLVVKALIRQLAFDLCYVFRHFPLTTVHPHAQLAAEAAEAAGAQGTFWDMHDILFTHQDSLDAPDLVEYASALELDAARLVNELTLHAHAARVRDDFTSGVHSGVSGTPAFFINGLRYDGPRDFDTMLARLVALIERAGRRPAR
jgi:protein-disulfide isomerase